jgi:predicted ABC-type exoprotein transport system permease subunit
MGGLSIFHWLIVLLLLGIVVFPIGRIVSRTGASGWWALLACVPLVNLVALWFFAFAVWKIDQRKPADSF